MRIASPSLIGMAFATIAGGTYVVTGHRDFTVDVHRPLPEVYSAFSDIRNFGSGLRNEGVDVPKVTVSRPSDHELVFTAPSANPGQISRVAFTFDSQPGSTLTRVSAAIDVPPIVMAIDGTDKVLSEDKIETSFREAIGEMGRQLDQGNSTISPRAKLALLLDQVAIASNPENMKKLAARVEHLKSGVDRVKRSLERDGYEVRYGPEPASLRWRRAPSAIEDPDQVGEPMNDLAQYDD